MNKFIDTEIIMYAIDGKPLNRKMYFDELRNGIEEIKEGKFITQEELEKESEKW